MTEKLKTGKKTATKRQNESIMDEVEAIEMHA